MKELRAVLDRVKRSARYYHLLLISFVVIGAFLRTYQFHDWMVFNPDQARDAQIIENVVTGKEAWPLLGPQSGNTRFALGPIFYYFAILAGKIFTLSPDVFAYPDLFFSVLTIPLLYLFLRKYFSVKIALTAVAVLAVSYFAIRYGRFAWNPNSIPFFSILFLYGLVGMLGKKKKENYFWLVCVAIGLGVGIQLHTVLLFSLPAVFFLTLLFLWRKHQLRAKSVALIVFIVLLFNIPQIIYEFETGGSNTRALLVSTASQSGDNSILLRNTGFILACQLQANTHILSSAFAMEACGRGAPMFAPGFFQDENERTRFFSDTLLVFAVIISVVFSLGGYALLVRGLRRKQDEEKKNFLLLVGVFNLIVFFVLIPVASEITLRYFIMLFLVPFVLFGLWLEYLQEKLHDRKFVPIIFFVWLAVLNIQTIAKAADTLEKRVASDVDTAIFGEIEPMVEHLLSVADGAGVLYVDGNGDYEKRYFAPLRYLAKRSGLSLVEIRKNTHIEDSATIIYITGKNKKQLSSKDDLYGATVKSVKMFHAVVIFVLRKP